MGQSGEWRTRLTPIIGASDHGTKGALPVLLPICKYVERSGERKACCLPVQLRGHKRGFIAVSCMANHQWVWCAACCDCDSGHAGCSNPLHWMERDSFDTGKRNHMQRHSGQIKTPSTPPSCKPALHSKRQRDTISFDVLSPTSPSDHLAPPHKRMVGPGFTYLTANSLFRQFGGPSAFSIPIPQSSSIVSSSEGGLLRLDGSAFFTQGRDIPGASPFFLFGPAIPSASGPLSHSSSSAASSCPSSPSLGSATASSPPSGEIRLLQSCKHTDRKFNRSTCPCEVRVRPHKRGYLAVGCTSGHQYVWCASCCDCRIGDGVGCTSPLHWMERDSFDTGKRNHQQRHLAENADSASPGEARNPRPVVAASIRQQTARTPVATVPTVSTGSCGKQQSSPLEALADAAIQMMEGDIPRVITA